MSENNYCTVAGRKIGFRHSGRGDKILLVHGITTNSFIWDEVARRLSERFEVVAIDLLGCGESDLSLDADYSIGGQAEMIDGFIRETGFAPCHFIGHDIGGGIGQIVAVRFPEHLRSISLLNPVGYDFWPVQPIVAMRTPILRQLAMATLDFGMLRVVVKRALYHRELVDDDFMENFRHQMGSTQRRKAFLRLARLLNNNQLLEIAEEIKRLELPMLILRGDADIYLDAEICERLHNEVPNSRFERTATAGHFVQVDEPDWVVEKLESFIEELS